MKRRKFLVSGLGAFVAARRLAAAPRHNVVLLLADNHRHDAIRTLGNGTVRTPALDRLVKASVSFTHCFCCDPSLAGSRLTLFTGARLRRDKAAANAAVFSWPWLPEILDSFGYDTFFTGVYPGAFPPRKHGFRNVGVVAALGDSPREPGRGPAAKPPTVDPATLVDSALRYLASGPRNPLFLCIAFGDCLPAGSPPEPFASLYKIGQLSVPKNARLAERTGNLDLPSGSWLHPKELTEEAVRNLMAHYYSWVSYLDSQVGRVLDGIQQAGIFDNTIFVYTSCSGALLGSHGLVGRESLFEESIRVPLIIRAPERHRLWQKSDSLCQSIDILPTICELAGVASPKFIDGLSLVPLLEKPTITHRTEVFATLGESQFMVRNRQWKLISSRDSQKTQLFRVDADPEELRDLSRSPSAQQALQELRALFDSQVGAI